MAKWVLGVKESVAFKWGDTGGLRTRKTCDQSPVWPSQPLAGTADLAVSSGPRVPPLGICWFCRKIPQPTSIPLELLQESSLSKRSVQMNMQTSVCTFTSDYAVGFCSGRISLWLFCRVFIETWCLSVKSHKPYLAQCKCKGKWKIKVGTAEICCKSIKENPSHIIPPLCYYIKISEGLCFITSSFLIGIGCF